jgi:hypothetical protein
LEDDSDGELHVESNVDNEYETEEDEKVVDMMEID